MIKDRTLNTLKGIAAGGLMVSVLAACAPGATVKTRTDASQATGKNGQAMPAPSFTNFPDMPVPGNAKMDLDRTVVFGGGEDWFGRVALSSNFAADQLFDFYKTELPKFGWEEITSVRSKTSVLTYQRAGRVVTIQLEGATLQGTDVMMTVSPKGAPVQAPPSAMK